MGKVLFQCPECMGTTDFIIRDGQLACLCSVEKANDLPEFVEDPPRNYQLIVEETDESGGLGLPFQG